MNNERTYRQLNLDVCTQDGIERARKRCSCKECTQRRYERRGYVGLLAVCVAWSLVFGWLFNHCEVRV